MTNPEAIQQDTERDPESPTDETTTDIEETGEEEAKTGIEKAGEEGVAADYQTRIREFDEVESSAPVVSVPVQSSQLEESDLKIQPPG